MACSLADDAPRCGACLHYVPETRNASAGACMARSIKADTGTRLRVYCQVHFNDLMGRHEWCPYAGAGAEWGRPHVAHP